MRLMQMVLLSLAIASCTTAEKYPAYEPEASPNEVGKQLPIIRLLTPHNGAFTCSGAVIGPRYAITAAHCIEPGQKYFTLQSADLSQEQKVKVVGVNRRADYALLLGDFHAYSGLRVLVHPKMFTAVFTSEEARYISCGFPYGGELFCSKTLVKAPYFSEIAAQSFMYPGMSGGPVIEINTGAIVAVNTGQGEISVISPLTEMFADFGIDESN